MTLVLLQSDSEIWAFWEQCEYYALVEYRLMTVARIWQQHWRDDAVTTDRTWNLNSSVTDYTAYQTHSKAVNSLQ